jgi:hypothetical protein
MRMKACVLAATLLSLALSGCLENQSSGDLDPSFRCPSGNCQGANSAGNMGGNHPF